MSFLEALGKGAIEFLRPGAFGEVTETGARAGPSFAEVRQVFPQARFAFKEPTFLNQLRGYWKILGGSGKPEILPRTDYSGGKTVQINPIQDNPVYVDKTIPGPRGRNTKFYVGAGVAGATVVGGTLIATNPGLQETAQSYSGAFTNFSKSLIPLGQGLGSITQVFANNPLLIVGGLILLGVVLLKK